MTVPHDVTIGRLSLHAGPMSEAEARRLAELVALALGRVPLLPAERVAAVVPAASGSTLEQVADAVARSVEDSLRAEGPR